jgi:hypothetical protein
MALSPAKAATETWNFNLPTGVPPGGTTQNYLSSPDMLTATAAGFASGGLTFTTPTNLFGKNDGLQGGSLETGLGIANTLTGNTDNEITQGVSFIRVTLPTGLTNIQASVSSITGTEEAQVFGSTSPTSGYVAVSGIFTAAQQGTLVTLSACPGCTFFAFTAVTPAGQTTASDVLLNSIAGTTAVVPLPGAIGLFGTGLGLIGLLASRRKRKLVAF